MSSESAFSPRFLSLVGDWISRGGEVLVVIRCHAAAGNRSYELFDSLDGFTQRLAALSARDSVIAFREKQLPLRGTVNEHLVERAKSTLSDNKQFLVVGVVPKEVSGSKWYDDDTGSTHGELVEILRSDKFWGKPVALGAYPPWWKDADGIVEALIPEADGSVVRGAY